MLPVKGAISTIVLHPSVEIYDFSIIYEKNGSQMFVKKS